MVMSVVLALGLERLSVMLWRRYEAESEVVRSLYSTCLWGA
jgi:hypothetical protein